MRDGFSRTINYARISVTDLCNLRCRYCMPDGVPKKSHSDILSLEELLKISEALADLGVNKQRITGGEPLVRKNVISLFERIGQNKKVDTLAITTNGVALSACAKDLKAAGVTNVNISIDTLSEDKFGYISKTGRLSDVVKGIYAACEQNFKVVKLNSVLMKGVNDDEVEALADFADGLGLPIRFIELMPFKAQSGFFDEYFISSNDVVEKYRLNFLKEKTMDDKVMVYAFESGAEVGFISPISHKFCDGCNRVRITADGKLLNCLHQNAEFDLKPYIDDESALKKFIIDCVSQKPRGHRLSDKNYQCREMDDIGG